MLLVASRIALVIAVAAVTASIIYLFWALWAVRAFGRLRPAVGTFTAPVTILKPVCGLDPGLYGNLRSFCEQDYPAYQVLFGVRDPNDPAIPVVERVIRDGPDLDQVRKCIQENTDAWMEDRGNPEVDSLRQ